MSGDMSLAQLEKEFGVWILKREEFTLGEKIGEGAFGAVFLATHTPTGRQAAVKQRFAETMQAKELSDFVREVSVLAKCNSDFLLPFFGFTVTAPFWIVTEFIPQGSLFNALRHKKGSPQLNGTQKTLVAMGIAAGMAALHQENVIHRDLKSLNVLLDDKLLPKICDFGVSRFANDENEMKTQEVGTPHWMAPELFESKNYNNKVDVYAYGILLWEMLTETTPFKGKQGFQIAMAVCRQKERPAFPDHVDKELKKLISACWHQEASKRPTFEKIVKIWESKKVTFPLCDKEAIDLLKAQIKEDAKRRKKDTVGAPWCQTASEPAPSTETRHKKHHSGLPRPPEAKKARASDVEPDYNAVTQIQAENWKINFKSCARHLVPENCAKFFTDCITIIGTPQLSKVIASRINKVIRTNAQILVKFLESGLIYSLPLQNDEAVDKCMSIVLYVVKQYPNMLDQNLLNFLVTVVTKHPQKFLCIVYTCLKMFDRLPNGWTITDYILNASVYPHLLQGEGALQFLQMINYLIGTYQQFHEHRITYVAQILVYAIVNLQNLAVVHAAYSMLNWYFTPDMKIPAQTLEAHMQQQILVNDVIGYLLRQRQEPLTHNMIQMLLPAVPYNQAAYALLLSGCDRPHFAERMIMCADRWIGTGALQLAQATPILMGVMLAKDYRPRVGAAAGFPIQMRTMLESQNADFIIYSITMIMLANPTKEIVRNLSMQQYFVYLGALAPQMNNAEVTKLTCSVIDRISRIIFCPEFIRLVPHIVDTIRNSCRVSSYMAQVAMSALVTMITVDRNAALEIKRYEAILNETFTGLEKVPQYGQYIGAIQGYLRQLG